MPERHVRRALRVTTGFRLRWLSERGCLDRGHCDHRWMLKRVPVRGGEWVWVALSAPRLLQPAAGRFLLLAARRVMPIFFEAHPAPMNSAPIAAWRPRRQDIPGNVTMPATGQEHRTQPGPHQPSPPDTGTRFSIPRQTSTSIVKATPLR